jgi:hypothetical protein
VAVGLLNTAGAKREPWNASEFNRADKIKLS